MADFGFVSFGVFPFLSKFIYFKFKLPDSKKNKI